MESRSFVHSNGPEHQANLWTVRFERAPIIEGWNLHPETIKQTFLEEMIAVGTVYLAQVCVNERGIPTKYFALFTEINGRIIIPAISGMIGNFAHNPPEGLPRYPGLSYWRAPR